MVAHGVERWRLLEDFGLQACEGLKGREVRRGPLREAGRLVEGEQCRGLEAGRSGEVVRGPLEEVVM